MDERQTLLAITSYNQITFTKNCFETLRNFAGKIVCIDDASEDPLQALCDEFKVEFIGRSEAKGLTYSWNLAYQMFIERGFDNLIISNNDVLFPQGSLEALVSTLRDYPYVGVLTRAKEPWVFAKQQAVENFYNIPSQLIDDPKNYQEIQNIINARPLPPLDLQLVYGFCFGVNRHIVKHQYAEHCLFNPANINVHQELDLASRVPEKVLCRSAFVYHYKSATFGKLPPSLNERRDELDLFRLKSARRLELIKLKDRLQQLFQQFRN